MILYYLVYKKNYEHSIPENVAQHYRDLFLMTLEINPSKRANIQTILNKIEERNINSSVNVGGCLCFSKRKILSSSSSTLSLVQKALNSVMISARDENLKKLITKV